MPNKCCVPGCRSNYDLRRGIPVKKSVTCFLFPKDETRRQLWLKKIRRKDYQVTKRSVVCLRHFHPKFVIKVSEAPKRKPGDGPHILKRPRLRKEAYPSIFYDESGVSSSSKNITGKDVVSASDHKLHGEAKQENVDSSAEKLHSEYHCEENNAENSLQGSSTQEDDLLLECNSAEEFDSDNLANEDEFPVPDEVYNSVELETVVDDGTEETQVRKHS